MSVSSCHIAGNENPPSRGSVRPLPPGTVPEAVATAVRIAGRWRPSTAVPEAERARNVGPCLASDNGPSVTRDTASHTA